jgi:hypothetical protein
MHIPAMHIWKNMHGGMHVPPIEQMPVMQTPGGGQG